MRYRLLASYQGAPYEAGIGPGESGVVLFAACPPPEELAFEPATGHWRKAVRRRDVQSLYESRPVGLFRGERCVVLDDLSDRLHIAYLGHDALKAEQLGYWEVDRGVFELIAPRQQVTEIVEERLPVTEAGTRSDTGIYAQNGHRATLRPADQGRGSPADTPGPLAGTSVPRSPGQPGHDRGGHGPDLLGPGGPVSIPPADAPPLPLEAEAMRAAAEATRRGKKTRQDQERSAEPGTPEGGTPVIPVAPAGLSEPSVGAGKPGTATTAVPSWTPPAQRAGPPQDTGPAPEPDTRAGAAGKDAPADVREPAPVLPGLGYSAHPTVAGYGEPGGTAARNGTHGRAAAQAVAEAPELDPYRHDQRRATDIDAQDTDTADAEAPDAEAPDAEAPDAEPADAGPPGGSSVAAVRTARLAAAPTAPAPASSAPSAPPDPEQAATATAAAATTPPVTTAPAVSAGPAAGTLPAAETLPAPEAQPAGSAKAPQAADAASQPAPRDTRASRRRRSARRRLPTQRIFSELADQAGIRPQAYAIGEDVDGSMCLVQTTDGFEVFNSLGGARHEVRMFADEESAYFYLFGVLAAEAVRTGTLGVVGSQG